MLLCWDVYLSQPLREKFMQLEFRLVACSTQPWERQEEQTIRYVLPKHIRAEAHQQDSAAAYWSCAGGSTSSKNLLLATICPTCRYHTNWIWSADLHCKCFVTQSINLSIYCYQTLFVDSYCRKLEYFSISKLDKQKHLEDQRRRSHVQEARMCPYGTSFGQQDTATRCASTCTAANLTIAGVNVYKENYRGRRQCGSHKVSVFRM